MKSLIAERAKRNNNKIKAEANKSKIKAEQNKEKTTKAIKLEVLEDLYGKYNVHIICEALNVPRGTFYNHILRNKRDNTWYAKRKEELRLKIQTL